MLVLLQLVGSHSEGIQWFRYVFIGWATVQAVWYAVTLVLLYRHPELHQAIRLMVAERRAPSSGQ